MRTAQRTVEVSKTIPVKVTIVKEDIKSISENKAMKQIDVVVAAYDENNNLIQENLVIIVADKYDLLMSANPNFAPNKPENEYRENDLWYIIDLLSQK